ncbi:hypothetical protein [Paenibacillus sp. DMB5]|uniref:hypothetical protein n=1 Tax=Paenibacillus sp. DMB5 TaxID=1780103 RepID=UPI00076D082E|nr:hypothetical protein [Paenibacillus sp. DMB5]KUP20894.1 hypothetical protein AWJ19_06405 [Paenibacillus sp. DMB5]
MIKNKKTNLWSIFLSLVIIISTLSNSGFVFAKNENNTEDIKVQHSINNTPVPNNTEIIVKYKDEQKMKAASKQNSLKKAPS